ncbi:MAG: Asp-tRNA(Asn)/Glu-tRNA(Gln) amidotransferase subunit GatB [Chlamydiae bacterium]|nr:Asp-tRNA(Asn)/Glu-tRNA(Gln) amidotransferase subunit GatB [Chlamydiota bacterium]
MTDHLRSKWQAVIGLEIHVQLSTKSKLFSVAPNRFGDEPNTNITEVCTGQPGALPILNKEAIRMATQFGCAVGANISKFSSFDRKSYFYPDSPRNFQITQFFHPFLKGGQITAIVDGTPKTFRIERAHIEDDAGMIKHFSNFAGIDYNRAGVALIEIVSEPCMHSAKEASTYAMAIKAIMEYLGASDCNMEEGSLRIDANISVRLLGEERLRNKIEIKNMNSFSNMELAIEAEIDRQIHAYSLARTDDIDSVITPATYRFDVDKKELVLMRTKEAAEDYRYFPEPDLTPIVLTDAYIEEIRKALPELPQQRYERYITILKLSEYAASLLINDKPLSDYFEEGLKDCVNPVSYCNWITVEFVGRFKDSGKKIYQTGIKSTHIANLVNMIEKGTINGKIAKKVVDEMVLRPGRDSLDIVAENSDFRPMNDTAAIEAFVEQVLSENPQSIEDFKAGRNKAFAHLVGQVMKLSQGKASPAIVNEILLKKLQG